MKQITKMSRLTGEIEKLFAILNDELFDGVLPTPILTAVPSTRSYAHYTPWDAWGTPDGGKREINISTAYLLRPLEEIAASLVHEQVHMYNDCILNEADTSNKGIYHNKIFAREAEAHGLIVSRVNNVHGYSHTEPGNTIIDILLRHNELKEIEIQRAIAPAPLMGTGIHTGNGNGLLPIGKTVNSHHRKYSCPCCGNSVRATKIVRVMCIDCNRQMIESRV